MAHFSGGTEPDGLYEESTHFFCNTGVSKQLHCQRLLSVQVTHKGDYFHSLSLEGKCILFMNQPSGPYPFNNNVTLVKLIHYMLQNDNYKYYKHVLS